MNEAPRPTLTAGMRVTPSVQLVAPLGAGGMGALWLADHTSLKTRVVVKFMHGELGSSKAASLRFSREAAAAAQVKSPHVVQMHDHGVTDEGVPFIVMEHLEGHDLGREIAQRGALEPGRVVTIVAQVAKALAKVHAAGLLHRDIKPDNIFLVAGDDDEIFVKLLDFGVAKGHGAPETTLDGQTKTGQIVGTPFYMSPEQVTAQKALDPRSDLWSLGVVAFEALTGKRPFDGPSFGALAVKIATTEAPRPSASNAALPPTVDAWFAKACAKEPESRFASAKELAEALRGAFEGVVSLPPAISLAGDSGTRTVSLSPPARGPSSGAVASTPEERERPSFVLASTVSESSPGPLARSEHGLAIGEAPRPRPQPAPPSVLALVGVVAVSGLAVAALLLGRGRGSPAASDASVEPSSSPRPSSLVQRAPPHASVPKAQAVAYGTGAPPESTASAGELVAAPSASAPLSESAAPTAASSNLAAAEPDAGAIAKAPPPSTPASAAPVKHAPSAKPSATPASTSSGTIDVY